MIIFDKKLFLRIILLLFIGYTLFFIWSNSLECADASSSKSNRVVEIVKPIIDPDDKLDIDTFTNLVRKFAHFSEFAMLGAEVCFLFFTFDRVRYRILPCLLLSVGVCFAAAVADELLQLTSDGRSCQFSDMMIDLAGITAGAVFAIIVKSIIGACIRKINTKRSANL